MNPHTIAMLLHKTVLHDSRVRREASALAAAGHRVVVFELDRRASGRLDGFERRSAAPPELVRRLLPFHLYRLAFLVWFVVGVVRLRPSVVHAHDAAMLLPGALAARLTHARLVYDSHELATGVPYRERGWAVFVALAERLLVRRADAVVTVTDGIADRLRERYALPARPIVVRNVCALPAGAPDGSLRSRLGIGIAPLILHQGAAAPDRGCEALVRALGSVSGAHLVFLGTGEPGFDAHLRALAAETEVAARTHFVPSVPLEQLLSRTAEADVGVTLLEDTCENHRLALPNKLFEYVAAGVPVVASDLPELRRALGALGTGRVADPGSSEQLAAVLRTALAESREPELQRRLGTARDVITWEAEQKRLLRVYARLGRPVERFDALLLVRNAVSHDARVLRAAHALASVGHRPLIVGVVADAHRSGRDDIDGIAVLRVAPGRRRAAASVPASDPAGGPRTPAHAAPPGYATRAKRLLTTLDFYRRGVGIALRTRPALVHANDHNTMWIGVAAKVLRGSRLVYDAHELWPDRNGRWEWRPWLLASEALFVRVADEVITASPGYAQRMSRRYRVESPRVVRNIPASRRAAPEPPEAPTLTYVGGLMPGRGLEAALEALALLPERVRLKAVGPGREAYKLDLRRRAVALGVGERLELLQPVPPDQVVQVLADALAGVCLIEPICGSYELTLPNKLFEYAAAGVPVLASDVPVLAGVVLEHGIGEVAPPGDPEAVAAAALRLMDPAHNREVRGRVAAFAAAETWERERTRLVTVYADASR